MPVGAGANMIFVEEYVLIMISLVEYVKTLHEKMVIGKWRLRTC